MEEEGGLKLSKRINNGEVDYKTKAGTAWSHNFLNQKPWHPLSYPNQRRKWIAEQTDAQRQRRTEEVSREYAQEQEFFRQTSLISKKEKEKVEMMQAVSFMYVRPPGYNAESAMAAEVADEQRQTEQDNTTSVPSTTMPTEPMLCTKEKKSSRPKDVFGRALPTEEEFEVLKNAPRLETGVVGRAKPFGVEIRNVKCVRCGVFGHQSGDRECPLKDAIMPTEESRLKRDDPLTAMTAHTDSSEPLKWELKQRPGMSPPRGGFDPDDPNQQIVAEDIFDEYGGFLGEGSIPEMLMNFPKKKKSSGKRKHKMRCSSPSGSEKRVSRRDEKHKKQRQEFSESGSSDDLESRRQGKRRKMVSRRDKKHKQQHEFSESSWSDDLETRSHGKRWRLDLDEHVSGSRHHCSKSERLHRAKSQKERHRSQGFCSDMGCRGRHHRHQHPSHGAR